MLMNVLIVNVYIKNIAHIFFILSMGIKVQIDSVMRPRSSSRGAQYKCLSYSYSYTSTVIMQCNSLCRCNIDECV